MPPDWSNDRGPEGFAEGIKLIVVDGEAERQTFISIVFPMEMVDGPESVALRLFRTTAGMIIS